MPQPCCEIRFPVAASLMAAASSQLEAMTASRMGGLNTLDARGDPRMRRASASQALHADDVSSPMGTSIRTRSHVVPHAFQRAPTSEQTWISGSDSGARRTASHPALQASTPTTATGCTS